MKYLCEFFALIKEPPLLGKHSLAHNHFAYTYMSVCMCIREPIVGEYGVYSVLVTDGEAAQNAIKFN